MSENEITPTIKANQMIDYFLSQIMGTRNDAKKCALYAVREIIKSHESKPKLEYWEKVEKVLIDKKFSL